MVHMLCASHLSISALLFNVLTLAIPIPYNPLPGEVVHYTAPQTNTVFEPGAFHPHVAVDSDYNGNVFLSPIVSHEHYSEEHHGPSIAAHGVSTIAGKILLDPVIVRHNAIHPPPGLKGGPIIDDKHLKEIQGAQALVQAHRHAIEAHDQARIAHIKAHEAHKKVSAMHFSQDHRRGLAVKLHSDQAEAHAQAAAHHAEQLSRHQHAIRHIQGPDDKALEQIKKDTALVHAERLRIKDAKAHGVAAAEHLKAASAHDVAAQAHSADHGSSSRYLAHKHTEHANHHRLQAYLHEPQSKIVPHPDRSMIDARISRHQAVQSKNTVHQHVHQPRPKHLPAKFHRILHHGQ